MRGNIIRKIVALTLMLCMLTSVSVFAEQTKSGSLNFRVRIVDKDGVPIANAPIAVFDKGETYDDNNFTIHTEDMTDSKGEFRIKSINPGTYNLLVTIKRKDDKGAILIKHEQIQIAVNVKNTKDTFVVKAKSSNYNKLFYDAKGRTDIYVKNSKGGPVSNMKLELTSKTPPQTYGAPYGMHSYAPIGFTDKDGRVTFVGFANVDYSVQFSWLGGKAKCDKTVTYSDDKVNTYTLTFDETLLTKTKAK